MSVGFRLLGDIEVLAGDEPIDVGHARQRCVLAVLLLSANRVVPVESLIERVWGPRPPRSARNTLHSYLVRLRQALAACDGVEIVRRHNGYLLTVPAESVDVHRFRTLAAGADAGTALALWRGEPFAGLDTPWLNEVRAALLAERFTLELDHTDLLLRKGEHARLVSELTARAAAHPVDERVAGQLMLALYRCGRQAEALDHYETLRSHLADTLGVDPGPRLRELHQRILNADPGLDSPPTAAPVPRQLPGRPRLFVGRDRELAELDKAVDTAQGITVIASISGPGGIGKTWLALHWAHQNADRFPDGQLYLDLHGFDPSGPPPTTPDRALRSLLDALAVPSRSVPAELAARAGLFRSLVADRRMLVVLDNAADAAQVVPLLPGSPMCTVLVTSRHRLDGLVTAHGAMAVELDVLHETEAKELLSGHVGHQRADAEPDATHELLTQCAGLPLAIAVVGARVAHHPDFPLAELAGELRDRSGRLDSLDTGDLTTSLREVCASSHRALGAGPAEMLVLTGMLPGPETSLAATASLAGRRVNVVRSLLRALEDANLVRQYEPGRYRLHDLIRLYSAEVAETTLDAQARDAALRRLVDHYLHTGFAGERLLQPLRAPVDLDPPVDGVRVPALRTVAEALTWFEAEYTNVLAAQHIAAARGWRRAVWQLAWTLITFQTRSGLGSDRIAVWEAALAAAREGADPAVLALAYRTLGYAHADAGHTSAALSNLDTALGLAAGDVTTQAYIHHSLARAHDQAGDGPTAMRHARLALDLHRTAGNDVGTARAGADVGWLAARQGHHAEARKLSGEALELVRSMGMGREGEAACLDNLGYVAHETGDHAAALRYYTEALANYETVGDAYSIADTHDHLARTHAALGDTSRAREHCRHALHLYDTQLRVANADRIRAWLATLP